MGYTPQQVDDMSLWQFIAAMDGYRRANNPGDAMPESSITDDDMLRWSTMGNA